MKTVFVDTNFFIQCKGIDSLKWDDLFNKNESINILIPRAVQKEVDNFKGQGKGRRSKKAKSANELFGLILDSSNGHRLTSRVTLSFTSKKELSSVPLEPSLDTTKNDDLIIQEIIAYRAVHPQTEAVLLTNDTGLMISAKEYDVPYIRIPPSWLLGEEPDERDKQIKALQAEITNLKNNLPKIDLEISPPSQTIEIKEYLPLTIPEVNATVNPIVTNAKYVMGSARFIDSIAIFSPPSQQEIDKYNNHELPDWQKAAEKALKHFHLELHKKMNSKEILFKITNLGNFPAENLLVEFSTSDALVLLAPFEVDEKAITLPPLPSPPGYSFMGIHQSIFKNHKRVYELEPFRHLPSHKDSNRFYWKDQTYSNKLPITSIVAECVEFRHKGASEEFRFLVSSQYGSSVSGGLITCKVSARNLPEPVIATSLIKFAHSKGDSFSHTDTQIEIEKE
jgi:rRNA-processing protein FCF1